MVDVSDKQTSLREATAVGTVYIPESVFSLLENNEISTKKGPVFQTAIIAGTQAVKKTYDLIPFCHPIAIEGCKFSINTTANNEVQVSCSTKVHHKTGVEMEALTGVTVAALTIYDMCKALSHEITIKDIHLIEKSGGKSDYKAKN